MKIKHENGTVTFVMRAGKDFVKSQMPIGSAQTIVSTGKSVTEKDGKIVVDDTYFFPTEPTPKGKKQVKEDAE